MSDVSNDNEFIVERFDHDPIKVLEDGLKRFSTNPDIRGAFVMVVDKTGKIFYNGASYSRQELLWGLEQLKVDLLREHAWDE